jgi:hypothetical protein
MHPTKKQRRQARIKYGKREGRGALLNFTESATDLLPVEPNHALLP